MTTKATERRRPMNQLMRRPDFGAPLRFIDGQQGTWRDCLQMEPDQVDQAIVRLIPLINQLPKGELRPERKMLLRKMNYREQASALHQFTRPLSYCPEVKADQKAGRELSRKLSRYESIRHTAGRGANAVLDLRLMLGALQWFMLQRVLTEVVARLSAKDCPAAERDLLQRSFSKLLLNKEALLQTAEERKLQRERLKQQLQDQLSEVEKRALVADVMNAIRMKLPIPAERQEAAARYYREMTEADAASAGAQRKTPR